MMVVLKIDNDTKVVVNAEVWAEKPADTFDWTYIVAPPTGGIGWTWNGKVLSPPDEIL